MSMFNDECNEHNDVHEFAILDSGVPMRECESCGLPVPLEAGDDIYCDAACQDKAMDEAILNDAIAQTMDELAVVRKRKEGGMFAELFPQVFALPEPKLLHTAKCSCHH